MKELIPMNEYGLFADKKDVAWADSRYVAKFLEKRHDHILRDIVKITAPNSGLSADFVKTNYIKSSYKDESGKTNPCYIMTRDGFSMLVMGYTRKKAMQFKEMYIKRFDEMESFIKTLVEARNEFPLLTENIKLLHDNPKPYHYSNECDMLNRIVLGKSAKQFREEHGIEKGESIRPFLTKEQIELLDILQKVDIGLMVAVPDFEKRKQYLNWYVVNREKKS